MIAGITVACVAVAAIIVGSIYMWKRKRASMKKLMPKETQI